MNDQLFWYNYTTEDFELRNTPDNDDDARQLIPQSPSAQSLYNLYRERKGCSILDAMGRVLAAACGEKWEDDEE